MVLFGTNNILSENEVAENNGDGIAAGTPYSEEAVANGIWTNKAGKNRGLDLADYPSGACTENDWGKNSAASEFDGCEKAGGAPPDFHAMGSGKSAAMTFEFNAVRRSSGPASGKAKLAGVRDQLGNWVAAKMEGRVTCLAVHAAQPGTATAGLIIEKSGDPVRIPPYSTLHIFVQAGIAPDGSPADWIATSNANEFGPGECVAGIADTPVSKGRIAVRTK